MSYTSTNGMFTYTITNNTNYVIEQLDYDIILSSVNRWESLVTIDTRFPSSQTITISFTIDTLGTNILGGASITNSAYINSYIYGNVIPLTANITMNNIYLYGLKTTIRTDGFSSYYHVLLHEIGHILGIGSFWYLTGCPKTSYDDNGTTKHYYTGTNAFREYNSCFAGFSNDAFLGIPIEDDGGAGTSGVHPEEGGVSSNDRYINGILHPGLGTELMTGWLDGSPVSTPLSKISLGFLEDIGYTVNYNLADVYTMSWLATTDANNLEQTYIQGFLDVSGGDIINRNGNLSVLDGTMDVSGDVTFDSKLSVGGDVSFNGTTIDICGNLYAQYPANSIPAAAINGQVEATPNFADDVAFQSNVTVALKAAIGSTTLPTGSTALKVTGDLDFTGSLLNNGTAFVSGATDLNGLSDAKVGGANFANGVLIGSSTTGTLDVANNNTGVGTGIFATLTSGDGNVGMGYMALNAVTTGSKNIGIGDGAARLINTGQKNVAIGDYAGDKITTGQFNTFIGSGADADTGLNALNYSTAIGYNATATANNQIMLGTISEEVVCPNDLDVKGTLKLDGTAMSLDGLSDVKAGGTNFTNSLLIGNTTTGSLSSAISNIGVGGQCLLGLTSGTENTSVGFASSKGNTTGSYNVTVGGSTNFANQTGSKNTMLGHQSGRFNTTDNGVAVGYRSLYKNTSGSNNTAIGFQSLFNTETGSDNTCVGYEALTKNTTGGQNTASGSSALYENTTGAYNSAYGYMSLYKNQTGHRNTASGRMSLYTNVSGAYNTACGMSALFVNDSGEYNSACGYAALNANTTGSYNVAFGNESGNVNTTGINNTFIGAAANAAAGLTNLSNSTAVGYNAKVTVSNQIMLGTASESVVIPGKLDVVSDISFSGDLYQNGSLFVGGATSLDGLSDVKAGGTNFTNSLLIGHNNTGSLSAAGSNVGVGKNVFDSLTSANGLTAIGFQSLYKNTTGGENTATGYKSLEINTTGYHNMATGAFSLQKNDDGSENTATGTYSMTNNTSGSYNTATGLTSLNNNETGNYNTAFGYHAGKVNTTGGSNTYIGKGADADTGLTGLNYSTAIGYNAKVTASNQVMLGTATEEVVCPNDLDVKGTLKLDGTALSLDGLSDVKAGGTNFTNSLLIGNTTTGTLSAAEHNIGIGTNALKVLESGQYNVAIGSNSLQSNTSGGYNVAIGSNTLATNATGAHNVATGYGALNVNTYGGFNVAIGNHVLKLNQSGGYNVATGYQALQNNLSGNYNVATGYQSGKINTTGKNNTYIGALADAATGLTDLSNSTAIGYDAKVTKSNQIMLGTAAEKVNIAGVFTINPIDVSVDVSGIQQADEYVKFTIPYSMTALKYFCTAHSIMIGDFILADSTTEPDKTYYVRMAPDANTNGTPDEPYYIFSDTPNGTTLNGGALNTVSSGAGVKLTLYKGNTYTFISTNTVGHPFMVGDSWKVTTGIKLESTGDGAATASVYSDPYPLHVNGTANIERNLNVARTLTVSGPIRQW